MSEKNRQSWRDESWSEKIERLTCFFNLVADTTREQNRSIFNSQKVISWTDEDETEEDRRIAFEVNLTKTQENGNVEWISSGGGPRLAEGGIKLQIFQGEDHMNDHTSIAIRRAEAKNGQWENVSGTRFAPNKANPKTEAAWNEDAIYDTKRCLGKPNEVEVKQINGIIEEFLKAVLEYSCEKEYRHNAIVVMGEHYEKTFGEKLLSKDIRLG